MWPQKANRDPKPANPLARDGLLESCTQGAYRYKWTSPSVDIRQLIEKPKKAYWTGNSEASSSPGTSSELGTILAAAT